MPTLMFILFMVWLIAMVLAGWALEVARMFVKRVGKASSRPVGHYQPRAVVILPIKGVDEDTSANVRALLAQDYPNCRLLFVVESEDDAALQVLEPLASGEGAGRMEIVVAGLAESRGQKIHNQLAAIARTSAADEVLVFLDADARPKPGWLRSLVAPLEHRQTSAATGYRFYVPDGRHPASAMVSVINAGVAALLGPPQRNLLWGGSMAIRRADFFAWGVHDAWQNALSDDYVMSYCVKQQAGGSIHFVAGCLLASSANFTWKSFFEFACRQYRITKVCATTVWLTAIGGAVVYLVALGYSLGFWIHGLLGGASDSLLLLMFLALYLTSVIRGYLLVHGGMRALPEQAPALRAIRFWYTWGYPAVVLMNLLALLGSAVGREVVWRGVSYRMISRTQTEVRRPAAVPRPAPEEVLVPPERG